MKVVLWNIFNQTTVTVDIFYAWQVQLTITERPFLQRSCSDKKATWYYTMILYIFWWQVRKEIYACICIYHHDHITQWYYHLPHSLQTAFFVHLWHPFASQHILKWSWNSNLVNTKYFYWSLPSGGQVTMKKSRGLLAPCSFTLCFRSIGFLSLSNLTSSWQYGTSCPGLNLRTCCLSIWFE